VDQGFKAACGTLVGGIEQRMPTQALLVDVATVFDKQWYNLVEVLGNSLP
jgi:hypothetical protein